MAAAVDQIEAPAVPVRLPGVALVDDEEGVAAAGRGTGAGLHGVFPGGQGDGVLPHLSGPRAAEARDGQAAARQVELGGEHAVQLRRGVGAVAQYAFTADAVAVGPDVVVRLQRKAAGAVAVDDAEMLGLPVLGAAAGQGLLARLRVVDHVAFIEEIPGAAAVRVHGLQHRLAQIALARRGELQTDVLQRDLRVRGVIADRVARRKGVLFGDALQRRLGLQRQPASVVKLLRLPRRQHAEAIGRACGLQHKGRPLRSKRAYHWRLSLPFAVRMPHPLYWKFRPLVKEKCCAARWPQALAKQENQW